MTTHVLGDTAVLDPGPVIEEHLAAIRAALPRLTTILITHRHGDHAPGAVPLKEATGARIIAPPGVLTDDVVDQRVHGGEFIPLEDETLEVIATPGHTPGHCSFLFGEHEALFVGDSMCTSNPLTRGEGPEVMPKVTNVDDERAVISLDAMEELEAGAFSGPDLSGMRLTTGLVRAAERSGALPAVRFAGGVVSRLGPR